MRKNSQENHTDVSCLLMQLKIIVIKYLCIYLCNVYCYRPTPKSNFALVFVFFFFLQDVDLEDFYFGSLNIDSSIVKGF